jgi:hypothetical protein
MDMSHLIETVGPLIDRTVETLRRTKFTPDPIAGEHFSKIVSLMSSAYKRHGFILERAILEQLKTCPRFIVWEDREFRVTNTADHIVDTILKSPIQALETQTNYSEDGHRSLQTDAFVFDKETRMLRAYEIKRGSGLHDSGKRRSILRDILCTQILLKSYGRLRDLSVANAESLIIFYYGKCSIGKPFSLTAKELDDHFGYPVQKEVEALNDYFRKRLFELLTG